MRSLNECKAEIFRRVEDRKKERRKKRCFTPCDGAARRRDGGRVFSARNV